MKILVVDDDVVCREALSGLLRRRSYEVLSATNGREALEMLATTDCRMVITDWVMPEVNGVTLCRAIREDFGHSIFIIILTSRNDKEDVGEGLAAGADEYMTKPFDPVEVWARVRTGERIIALTSGDLALELRARRASVTIRFPYGVKQWVTPCAEGFDEKTREFTGEFTSVECHELCAGGVSFYSDDPFKSGRLVITVGSNDDRRFMFAEVVDRKRVRRGNSDAGLVECRFIRRAQIDKPRWEAAMSLSASVQPTTAAATA